MNDLDDRLSQWNPVPPADISDTTSSAAAAGLLQMVLSQPAQPAGRAAQVQRWPQSQLRLGKIIAATVAAIGGLALGLFVLHSPVPGRRAPAEQLVALTIRHGTVTVLITNPLAAAGQLTAALRAHGLNIIVQTVPVSPSLVGTIVYTDAPIIRSLWKPACSVTGCPVGLVLPAGYTGRATIAVGRPARPGEGYQSAADVFAPGEALHCSGLLGAPATAALPVLRKLGLHATWWALNWATGHSARRQAQAAASTVSSRQGSSSKATLPQLTMLT